MTIEAFIAFAVLNFLYSIAPGPNAAVIAGASLRRGVWSGATVLFGICLAEVVWAGIAMAVVIGLLDLGGTGIASLHVFGAVALVLLGTMMVVTPAQKDRAVASGDLSQLPVRHLDVFLKGGFVGLTNPLALVFFISVAPGFLPSDGISATDALCFTFAAVLSCAAAHFPYLCAAGLKGGTLTHWMERGCGMALCILGASTLVSTFSIGI